MTRRLVALPLVLVALLAQGCLTVAGHEADQPTGGPVTLTTSVCLTMDTDPGPATRMGCDTGDQPRDTIGTVYVAYLVPQGSDVKSADLLARAPVGNHELVADPSYAAIRQAKDPAPAGREWVGFKSPFLDEREAGGPDVEDRSASIATVFDPPAGAETFPHESVVQTRFMPESEWALPTVCDGGWACSSYSVLDSATIEEVLTLKDVAVEAGAPVAVERGQTAQVPFTARYVGGEASETFPLSATSGAGTPSVDAPSVAFEAAGAKPVTVSVPVPEGTPAGPQDVTLTVALPDGVTRTATGRIDVTAKPAPPAPPAPPVVQPSAPQPPAVAAVRSGLRKLTLRTNRRSSVLRSGLRFTQDFVLAGRATWELRRTGSAARLARLTRQVRSAGSQSVTLRLTKAGKRALRRKSLPKLEVRTTFVDALGRRSSVTVPIRLR